MKKQPRYRHRGMTLIELACVLAIFSLLAAIAAPPLLQWQRRMRAESLISELTTHVALARLTAVSRGKPVVLCPSANQADCLEQGDWAEGWIVFVDGNRNREHDDAEDLIYSGGHGTGTGITLRSAAGRQRIRLLPGGFGYGTNLTLVSCVGNMMHASVIMNNAGRVRVQRPSRGETSGGCNAASP